VMRFTLPVRAALGANRGRDHDFAAALRTGDGDRRLLGAGDGGRVPGRRSLGGGNNGLAPRPLASNFGGNGFGDFDSHGKNTIPVAPQGCQVSGKEGVKVSWWHGVRVKSVNLSACPALRGLWGLPRASRGGRGRGRDWL